MLPLGMPSRGPGPSPQTADADSRQAKVEEAGWGRLQSGSCNPDCPLPGSAAPALALAPEAAPAGEPYRGSQPNKKKQASSASRQAEMEETCFFN
ncbi:hypothetical protein BBD40_29075 [Paenibacillus ihbetae]|uniref:Uncharacterized protein n=1 Tax=Paenibacillus ihbetae TaxID=1870820 RepID=A0ABX3JMC9_9BACL|nr:hypothetical protein BBD40_29075 [Paenibacillus ihbetae]